MQAHSEEYCEVEDLVSAENAWNWLDVSCRGHPGLEEDAKGVGETAVEDQRHEAITVAIPKKPPGNQRDPAEGEVEGGAEPGRGARGENRLQDDPADRDDPDEGEHAPSPSAPEEDGVDRSEGCGDENANRSMVDPQQDEVRSCSGHQDVADATCEELKDAGKGEDRQRSGAGDAPGAHAHEAAAEQQHYRSSEEVSSRAERLAHSGEGLDLGGICEHMRDGDVTCPIETTSWRTGRWSMP